VAWWPWAAFPSLFLVPKGFLCLLPTDQTLRCANSPCSWSGPLASEGHIRHGLGGLPDSLLPGPAPWLSVCKHHESSGKSAWLPPSLRLLLLIRAKGQGGVAGTARVIGKATCGQSISCPYQLVAACGTGLQEGPRIQGSGWQAQEREAGAEGCWTRVQLHWSSVGTDIAALTAHWASCTAFGWSITCKGFPGNKWEQSPLLRPPGQPSQAFTSLSLAVGVSWS
jgi:hypothetical protein